MRKRLAVTEATWPRNGAPPASTEDVPALKTPDSANDALHSRYSSYSGAEIQNRSKPMLGNWVATRTSSSGAR